MGETSFKRHYELPRNIIEQMKEDPRAVQAAISVEANKVFGRYSEEPMGIYKYQGGVKVNGHEIVIDEGGYVWDNQVGKGVATKETDAVVKAIETVAAEIKKNGVVSLRGEYGTCFKGDPLRYMLELD